MASWAERAKISTRECQKIEGKVSERVRLVVARGYLYEGRLVKPLEEITDKEFLACPEVGPKTLAEIRMVIPASK